MLPQTVSQASLLLQHFDTLSESELARYADDILVYFRSLHDHWMVVKSSSPRFSGSTFIILEEVMYHLEAHPDETLKSPDLREFMRLILEDIADGRILIAAKESMPPV